MNFIKVSYSTWPSVYLRHVTTTLNSMKLNAYSELVRLYRAITLEQGKRRKRRRRNAAAENGVIHAATGDRVIHAAAPNGVIHAATEDSVIRLIYEATDKFEQPVGNDRIVA